MRRPLSLVVPFLLLALAPLTPCGQSQEKHESAQAGSPQVNACWQRAVTQLEMNQCTALELRVEEAEMNDTFRQVLAKFSSDVGKINAIKAAQAAWVAYRDAEVNALFPETEQQDGGTARVMCRPLELARLTRERAKELKQMLKHREGDVCSQ